ncbi:phage portal protein [Amycolatopsis jejuensis]|uniref:phage portal protein n=1 Tax=Amycolatopsis jejuensis TaxID=330084 RepID=UPI000525B9C6|nr:phage portal protein [Amycolatopsis jejuensis]
MATEAQALQLVALLEQELLNRSAEVERNDRYYRGKQPLKYASDQFKKYHGDRYVDFSDNWVAPVADAPVERLTVMGIKGLGEQEPDSEMWRVWQTNALDADSQLGFLGGVNSARSFGLVWGNPDDEETPEVTFEDASQCVIAYWPGSRRRRRAALKKWQDGNCDYATLYLPDEVWKFERPVTRQQTKLILLSAVDEELKKWSPRDTDEPNPQPNPMGVVPLVELPNKPTLADDPISDVTGVTAMQDAVNLLWAQLFTASDYASFPQRIVLGAERPTTPILNDKGEVVGQRPVDLAKFAVDRVLWITGEQSKIAEWQAANLAAYTDVIEIAVGHIAAQTRTPQHYLIGKMANLSGDALIAAETGLVKRVEEKQLWFGQAIRQMFGLIALAQGNEKKAKAFTAGTVLWADAESRSQAQLADALLKLAQIGFPFEYLAAKWGLTPSEIVDLIDMKKREAEIDPVAAVARDMGLGGQAGDPGEEPTGDAA